MLAQADYDATVQRARAVENEYPIGEARDVTLDRAYRLYAEAAQIDAERWEAFAARGTNRCKHALACRQRLAEVLSEARARGSSVEEQQRMAEAGQQYIRKSIADASANFQIMERNMRRKNQLDVMRLRFAKAATMFAAGDMEEGPSGGPGAIDEFKALVADNWNKQRCSEFIARGYLTLGADAARTLQYEKAHAHWDRALEWAVVPATRRLVLTNKAAAYDLDNEFRSAEAIIRKLIEFEPRRPEHWKHLGLMLGHQNRLRGALRAYARARDLVGPVVVDLHGNAWLKAAMIHGKLLERDGDPKLAWRLFAAYRARFGDDYNFCVNFGEFAFYAAQYDVAWTFLQRAAELQPFCAVPRQLLLMTAQRMGGPVDVARTRIAEARKQHRAAQRRFKPTEESDAIKRMCAGLRDRHQPLPRDASRTYVTPDPLAGFGTDRAPPWIAALAQTREPFSPDAPDELPVDERTQTPAEAPSSASPVQRGSRRWIVGIAVAAVVALGVVLLRRRSERA